uniref:Putative secreted protein n=1 Tax=Ixodes ricinus TaxID=34613 RepID=A0A6B0U2N2_IXORI
MVRFFCLRSLTLKRPLSVSWSLCTWSSVTRCTSIRFGLSAFRPTMKSSSSPFSSWVLFLEILLPFSLIRLL